MTGVEFVVGYLVAWVLRTARRVGKRLDERVDADVDVAIDAGLERLHELVVAKLGGDPALAKLEVEAKEGVESPRTHERVRLALEDAAEQDPSFGVELTELVNTLRAVEARTGIDVSIDQVAVGRDVDIHADDGSAAAWKMGNVTFGSERPDPTRLGPSHR
ncbi:MAG: hypothetical protein ACRDQV_08295 [Pseudonocardiaceae bacterium]